MLEGTYLLSSQCQCRTDLGQRQRVSRGSSRAEQSDEVLTLSVAPEDVSWEAEDGEEPSAPGVRGRGERERCARTVRVCCHRCQSGTDDGGLPGTRRPVCALHILGCARKRVEDAGV